MRTLRLVFLSVLAVAWLATQAHAAAPVVTTTAATGLSNSVATLNGMVNPNGVETTAWFEWGPYTLNNTNLTTPVLMGSGSASVSLTNLLTGLTPGLIYHTRLVASNVLGVVRGADVPFGSPALTLNGAANMSIGYQGTFNDPGATASGAPLDIAAGSYHSLTLKSDGTVAAWGYNASGQTTIPVGLGKVVAIAAGSSHNLALKRDGTVVGWGAGLTDEFKGGASLVNYGQSIIPVGLSNVVAIAAGAYHSLALKSDGTVVVWGDNRQGQKNIPEGLSNVMAIVAGDYHSLALKLDGTVAAWGDNSQGQTTIPEGLSNVVAIAGGDQHSLALKSDGTVAAWGDNSQGQTTIPMGLSNVVAIAGGLVHSLALKRDGTVTTWGYNVSGLTVIPAGLSNVVAIARGRVHSLMLKSDGTVAGWGGNTYGQTNIPVGLGNVPVAVGGSVNSDMPGTYTLVYSSTNMLGGVATPVIRNVVVTPPPPTPVTRAPSGQSNTVAMLNGAVNPNSSATTAWFEWGLYPVNNTNLTPPVAVGGGSDSRPGSTITPRWWLRMSSEWCAGWMSFSVRPRS